MNVQPIILAAGKGTRMGNPDLPKVLTPLAGRPVVAYLLDSFAKTPFLSPVIVIGFHGEKVKEAFGDGYRYVEQDQLLGTGYAVMVAEAAVKGTCDIALVVYGDQPLTSPETFQRLVEAHQAADATITLLTVKSDDPTFTAFGRILRDGDGEVAGIREYKDASEEERAITEFNAGVYCFRDSWLWPALHQIGNANVQGEYYLTDLLAMAVESGEKVVGIAAPAAREAMGINTPQQLAEVESALAAG